MTSYVIRGGAQGKARLGLLSEALRPTTLALLNAAGARAGMACLDVGCGGGHVTLELARRVGAGGTVVGVDMDEIKLALARQDAAEEGLANVTFCAGDATALEDEGAYDLVYARFLLTHLLDPQAVVRQMLRAARPGGAVVLEDLDHSAVFSYPASAALEQYVALYNRAARLRGGDPEIGPKLPGLLRQAGVHDVRLRVVQPTFMDHGAKHIHQITLVNIADALVAGGLASRNELAVVEGELEVLAQDPHTLVSFPRIFQVWGRRSEDGVT